MSHYQIKLKGHLDESWAEWLHDLTIRRRDDSTTILTGAIADQAALCGLLSHLHGLGLTILIVEKLNSSPE